MAATEGGRARGTWPGCVTGAATLQSSPDGRSQCGPWGVSVLPARVLRLGKEVAGRARDPLGLCSATTRLSLGGFSERGRARLLRGGCAQVGSAAGSGGRGRDRDWAEAAVRGGPGLRPCPLCAAQGSQPWLGETLLSHLRGRSQRRCETSYCVQDRPQTKRFPAPLSGG